MIFLPVKPLGPFEHVHEGQSELFKYCRPEFYCVLFYGMKQKYFVSDKKYFVVMDISFFIYNVLGGETFILYSTWYKSFSTKYVVHEKINIHNNEIFHVHFAILQKTTEKTCKNVQ